MKKKSIIFVLLALCLLVLFLTVSYNQERKKVSRIVEDVRASALLHYEETLELHVDERCFRAEEGLENEAERAVFMLHLGDFLLDNGYRRESLAQNRQFEIELQSERRLDEDRKNHPYLFTIHEMETIELSEGEGWPEVLDGILSEPSEFDLEEYRIVKMTWTEERPEPANYGNGTFERYFLCGTSGKDPVWRIYAFGFL